jgi:hypothetical protein
MTQTHAFVRWYSKYVRSWKEPTDCFLGYPPPYIEVAQRAWEAGAKWKEAELKKESQP